MTAFEFYSIYWIIALVIALFHMRVFQKNPSYTGNDELFIIFMFSVLLAPFLLIHIIFEIFIFIVRLIVIKD